MYEYGIGVKQDYKKALNYYHAGWEYSQELQGKINFKLGDFSKNGKGTEQDFRGAEHYFRYGTRDHEEDSDCEYNLGLMYELGLVVDRDVKKAIELYNKAIKFSEQFEEKEYILAKKKLEFLSRNKEKNIDNIDLEKTHNLALEYYQKKDLQKAFELFTKSAENGNPESQLALAKMYEKGEGCLKDSFENLYWYSRAAKNGNLEAQLFLGDFYINGIELTKNFALAFEFFYLASENGNPKAQCSIGIMYELGLGGVQQNPQKAFEYYKKSAEQNYEKAKEKLDLLSPKKSNIKANSFFIFAYIYYCMGRNKKYLSIAFKYFYKASLMGNNKAQFYLGDMYESGEGTEKDDLEAIYWYFKSSQNGNKESENKFKVLSSMKGGIPSSVWEYYRFFEKKKLADRGDANAQFEIAQKYRTGDGVQKSIKKAYDLYKISAKNGNVNSMNDLGVMYLRGNGVKKDYNKAFELFKETVKKSEDITAKTNMAHCYYFGKGVKQDYNKAFELYKETAESGDDYAQNELAIMYENGEGCEKNLEKAFYWYKKSAKQGYSTGQCNLAIMYKFGQGVKKNYKKAFYWFSKSAENGNSGAQLRLGMCYEEGKGCEKDIEKAIYWYKKAVKNGDVYANVAIGNLYFYGKKIEQNYKQAIYWYKKAINSKSTYSQYAQFSLGKIYEKGLGIEKDYKMAFELYQQSAIQGHKKAQYRLGYLYEKGKGTEKNLEKALEWYKKSAEQNYKKAQNAYERLSKKRV